MPLFKRSERRNAPHPSIRGTEFHVEQGWEGVHERTGLAGYSYELTDSEFHPSKVLPNIHQGLDFLGHGASKWTTERDRFVDMLVHLDDEGERCGVRLLLLDPSSEPCLENSARLFPEDPQKWPKKILRSLQSLGDLEEDHHNLEVKVYKYKPIFRLTIVNGVTAVIGHYRNYHRDSDASPLLVIHKGPGWSFFGPFQQLFEKEWHAAYPVDWEGVARQADELGVKRLET
jgi:hypothetical protein